MKNRKFKLNLLTGEGFDEAIVGIDEYKRWLENKSAELVERLAEEGLQTATLGFASAVYDGLPGQDAVMMEVRGSTARAVIATGPTCLFIEFGTGITYPDDHPEAAQNGMIRGTYGKGHGNQRTWGYYGDDLGSNGKYATRKDGTPIEPHVVLTHGNPANKPMYNAVKELEQRFKQIVSEVFSGD